MPNGIAARMRASMNGPGYRWWALGAVECGNFVVYMDGFIVTLALPAMARHFGVGIHEIKWVLIAYLATLTMALQAAGRLADRWGRKPVTIAGMALLTLGAALCVFAPTLPILIAFRAVQGLGGALVLANVMAEIAAVFPKEERRRAMAVNSTVLALGQITGLALGGFLLGCAGWRSIFLLIAGVGAVGLLLDAWALRPAANSRSEPMDWLGAALSFVLVGTPFLLIERLSGGLFDPVGLAALAALPILLALFVAAERRNSAPLLDLRLFRLRAFTCGSIAAAFYFIVATFGYFLMPLYAQVVLGLSPFAAGLLLVPLSLALTASSQLVGQFAGRLSARVVSTAGLLCVSGAVFGMSLLTPTSPYPVIIGLLALAGIGGGLFHPPNNSNVLGGVPPDRLGAANGFFTTARNFGQALGAALAAAILGHGLASAGAEGTLAQAAETAAVGPALEAYMQAQAFACRVGASFGLAGALISLLRGGIASARRPAPAESK